MFNLLGGYIFMVVDDGLFHYDGHMIKAFVWIPNAIKELIQIGNCIQLDASFNAVHPEVFCTPMMIYRNTGMPLGLVVGPTECSELYSLLYQSFYLIDHKEIDHSPIQFLELESSNSVKERGEKNEQNTQNQELREIRLFDSLLEKYVLSDQHSSLEKLQGVYKFELFYCYVHIIRSFGSSRAKSILVREIFF